jgi:two-component system CheB/CheR fusion protein
VQDADGHWYSLRLRPYRTAENKIEGVVLALFDIDAMKRTLAEVEEARNLAQAVIETTREPLVVLTAGLRIQSANEAFYRFFHMTRESAAAQSIFAVVHEPGKQEVLKSALEGVLPSSKNLNDYEIRIDLPGTGPTTVLVNLRQIASAIRTYPLILLSFARS